MNPTDLRKDVRGGDDCGNDDFDGRIFRQGEWQNVRHKQILRQGHLNGAQVNFQIAVTRKLVTDALENRLEGGGEMGDP